MGENKETFGSEFAKKLPVDKIYEDVAQPLAQSVGTTLSIPIDAINAALSNVRKWINEREYTIKAQEILNDKLLEYLKGVPPERIVPPDRFIVLPLLRDINYVCDNEVIYEKYASLLATNMDSNTKNLAHPSFIQIIEQLSPLDAKIIDSAGYLVESQPLIRIFACNEPPLQDKRMADLNMPEFGNTEKKIPLFSHYSYSVDGLNTTAAERNLVIQNLNRLGLINIDYREHIIDATQYKPLYQSLLGSSFYLDFVKDSEQKGRYLGLTDGYTSPTDFGRLFYSVCCKAVL